MLRTGLDLSRRKIDVCLLAEQGEHLDQLAVPPDVESLRTLARRIDEVHAEPVCAVVESMTGARLAHDTLEREGWAVEIADAHRLKGLAPLALKTDRTDSLVLATLSQRAPDASTEPTVGSTPSRGESRESPESGLPLISGRRNVQAGLEPDGITAATARSASPRAPGGERTGWTRALLGETNPKGPSRERPASAAANRPLPKPSPRPTS